MLLYIHVRFLWKVSVCVYDSMSVCVCQECETLCTESEEAIKQIRITERENKRLKSLMADLGRQVQTLLKEKRGSRNLFVYRVF